MQVPGVDGSDKVMGGGQLIRTPYGKGRRWGDVLPGPGTKVC